MALLQIQALRKSFGPIVALDSISLQLEQGRIYGLAGENGAGKSTLVKILSGVHTQFEGQITFADQPFRPRDPREAEAAGISVFHQEIPICPNLSVAANLFLGSPELAKSFFPDWRRLEQRCEQLFADWLEVKIDARRPMGACTSAERQLTLLVRALSRNGRLIILDEPTTALTPPEVAHLFRIIRRLQAQGITFVFISHLLDELMELSDEIYVLRDGALVGHLRRDQFNAQDLATLIAGRARIDLAQGTSTNLEKAVPRLEVRDLSRPGVFVNVSFNLQSGEVLGITGLQGSGRSALARALFGAPPADQGEVRLDGHPVALNDPRTAIQAGIGYVPEDRKTLGLFDDLDIQTNLGVARLESLASGLLVSRLKLRRLAEEMGEQLHIKMAGPGAPITSLSGGNQQKVLMARWLAMKPKVLVLNEPTRGIDVGAKDDICRLIRTWAAQGYAFLVSSSDLDELLRVTDRILVMCNGRVSSEFKRSDATKAALIHAASGIRQNALLP